MYCQNCGKQLPEGARFCNVCGAPQMEARSASAPEPVRQASYPPPQPVPQPKKKSKAGPIIAVAVVLAALLLGHFVIAPAMRQDRAPAESAETETGDPSGNSPGESWSRARASARRTSGGDSSSDEGSASNESGTSNRDNSSVEESRETNDAYFQALSVLGYQVPTSDMKMKEGLENPTLEFFVRDNGDGSIECYDYAAEGDTVVKYYETFLLDLTILPAEEKERVIGSLTERLPELNELDFVTADYKEGNGGSLGILSVICTDLDREENRQILCDMGIFSEDGSWSLSELKKEITSAGFISMYK